MRQIQLKDRRGNCFAIQQDVLKIGRAIDNDIVLNDMNVSRYHLAVQPTDAGLIVFNTGSEAGFYINEESFLDTAIAHGGDILRVGQEEFYVDIPTPHKAEDFSFQTQQSVNISRTSSLDTNSRAKKIRIAAVLMLVLMAGVYMMPDETPVTPPKSASTVPTQGLPSDSFNDIDTPRLGPQELTAEDLYKRGMREVSSGNFIRGIQYYQQSLVEDPSLIKAERAQEEAKISLKRQTEKLVTEAEKNYKDTRLHLSRSQSNQALDLMSEQIPGFSFQVQQKQRSLATQRLPVLSREQLYLELPCDQTPEVKLCERAIEILKRSRIKLGEENILK